jgi:hyaluronan synthase
MVLALMVVSSVLSMAIRQIRHLSEKPSDFFRLPVFIIVSTVFLMPVRLIGFFRMGHASGWGTRAGAYAGGASNDDAISQLAQEPRIDAADTPIDSRELVYEPSRSMSHATAVLEASPRRAAQIRTMAPAGEKRRLNPKAGWPYIIGFTIFAVEAYVIVNF